MVCFFKSWKVSPKLVGVYTDTLANQPSNLIEIYRFLR